MTVRAQIWLQKHKQLLKRTGIAIIVVLTVFALLVLIFYRAQLALSYLQVLVWPCVVIFALIRYRRVIESLASQSEVTVTIMGFSIKIPLKILERSLEENLPEGKPSSDQWERLKELRKKGRVPFNYASDYEILLPLRNAGLIKAYPGNFLTTTKEVEITTLGKLLLQAWEQSQESH